MCSCEQGADSSQARVCGSRVPKHGHMRGICIARQVRPESSSDAWSDRGGVGRLPSAQDGAERGTAWQATAGLNCPAWPAALCQGQPWGCATWYSLDNCRVAVVALRQSQNSKWKTSRSASSTWQHAMRCQPAVSTRRLGTHVIYHVLMQTRCWDAMRASSAAPKASPCQE